MGYGDTEHQRNGIDLEKPAVEILKAICSKYGIGVFHNSEENRYDVDVILKYNNREYPVDIKTPYGKNKSSGNISITFNQKNYGPNKKAIAFLDANILIEENLKEKSVAFAPNYTPRKIRNCDFFIEKKTHTVEEFLTMIKDNII